MTDGARRLVIAMLREAVAVAPQPWRPGEFARARGLPDEQVEACLGLLRSEGVVAPAPAARNGEVVLTDGGARLAKDPTDLDYFCAEVDFALPGETPSGNPLQRKVIAATLREPAVPRLSRLVLWANLLVFGWGVWLAAQKKIVFEFLMPFRVVNGLQFVLLPNVALTDILDRLGWLHREDFVSGRWWRLMTCCFLHFGVIHLALNMLALRAVGRDVEWAWGGWRFLVIYLLSALGGSCAALTTMPGPVVGASGAICGLVSAAGVWLVLNRRYLPRRMVRVELFKLVLTGLLITALSLAPGVSGAGHLGGAVVGLVAAVLLHFHRFGRGPLRVLTLAGLLALAPACILGLKERSERDPAWKPAIEKGEQDTLAKLAPQLVNLDEAQRAFNKSHLEELLGTHHARRDPVLLREARAELPDRIKQFHDAAERLEKMAPFRSEQAEQQRVAALDYFRKDRK